MKRKTRNKLFKALACILAMLLLTASIPVVTFAGVRTINVGDGIWINNKAYASTIFEFTAPYDGEYTVYTTSIKKGDPFLLLYDSSGNFIDADDDGGGNLNATITFPANEGDSFRIEADQCCSWKGAKYLLCLDGTIDIQIDQEMDVYNNPDENSSTKFKFTAPYNGTFAVYTDCLDYGDPYLYLYNSNMECIDENDDSGEDCNSLIYFYADQGNVFYIEASEYDTCEEASYVLNIDFANSVQPDENLFDPDSSYYIYNTKYEKFLTIYTQEWVNWEGFIYYVCVEDFNEDSLQKWHIEYTDSFQISSLECEGHINDLGFSLGIQERHWPIYHHFVLYKDSNNVYAIGNTQGYYNCGMCCWIAHKESNNVYYGWLDTTSFNSDWNLSYEWIFIEESEINNYIN